MPSAIPRSPAPTTITDTMDLEHDDDYSPGFEEEEIYFPVFCITEVPNHYFDAFNKHAGENDVSDVPWIEITTSDGSAVLDDLRENASSSEPSPTPFKDWTIERIYQFYLQHLRPSPDGEGSEHFTSFTFFAIDAACVQAEPMECIVCSDAPDFGEEVDEIRLKTFRMPIAEVMSSMSALEMLSMTPSEVRDRKSFCLKVHPQPMLVADQTETNTFRMATPAEGRANKRAGIRISEELDLASDGTTIASEGTGFHETHRTRSSESPE